MIQYMYFCQTCWPKLADWQYRGLLDTVWKNIGLVDHYGNVTCQSMLNGTQRPNIIGRHLHRTGSGACGWIFFIWWLHASIIYSCRIMCEHCGRHILRTWADTKCCKLKERILNISSSEYFNGPYARQLVELKGFNCQLKREILNFMLSVEYLLKCTWIYWLHVLILLFLHFTYRYDDDLLVLTIKKREHEEKFQVQWVCVLDRKIKVIFAEFWRTLIVRVYIDALRTVHK